MEERTSGFFCNDVAMASSMLSRLASGVRRNSSELAGGNLMLVTGSAAGDTAGVGISGSDGNTIRIGSGIP